MAVWASQTGNLLIELTPHDQSLRIRRLTKLNVKMLVAWTKTGIFVVDQKESLVCLDPVALSPKWKRAFMPELLVSAHLWNDYIVVVAESVSLICQQSGEVKGQAPCPFFEGGTFFGISADRFLLWSKSGHLISYCLLYTSPSPRDATLSRMPSSA